MKRITGYLLCAVLSLSVVGCAAQVDTAAQNGPAVAPSSEADPTYSGIVTVNGLAILDPVTEVMTMPIDRYDVSMSESRLIDYAPQLGIQDCMQVAGYSWEAVDPAGSGVGTSYSPGQNWRWGIWGSEQAQYGYERPPADAVTAAKMAQNGDPADPDEARSLHACLDSANSAGLSLASMNVGVISQSQEAAAAAEVSDEGEKAQQDWGACIEKAGLEPARGNIGLPAGVNDMTMEDQISTATIDIGCKNSTRMIQRLADLTATYQQRYVADHLAELEAGRDRIEQALQSAQQIIAEHG